MKVNLPFVFILFFSPFLSFSQSDYWKNHLDTTVVWVVDYSPYHNGQNHNQSYSYQIEYGKDSIINGIQYHSLFYSAYEVTDSNPFSTTKKAYKKWGLLGFNRIDSGKVYFKRALTDPSYGIHFGKLDENDNLDTNEYLVADFYLSEQDEFYGLNQYDGQNDTIAVLFFKDKSDTLYIDGELRINTAMESYMGYFYRWMEGIGPISNGGPIGFYCPYNETIVDVTCYSFRLSDSTYYPEECEIEFPATQVNETSLQLVPEVYPNPSHGDFKVRNLSGNFSVSVLNINGQEVFSKNGITENEVELDADLNNGVYWVHIHTEVSDRFLKIVVVNH